MMLRGNALAAPAVPGAPDTASFRFDAPAWTDGRDLDAVVLSAEETASSAGAPMLTIDVGVPGPSGGVRVREYQTWSTEASERFLYALLAAVAPEALAAIRRGEAVDLRPDQLVGRRGFRVRLKLEPARGDYGPRPRVAAWVPMPSGQVAPPAPTARAEPLVPDTEEVPF